MYFICQFIGGLGNSESERLIGISGSLIWSKTLMEVIFNLCGEFRWSPECPVSQIHSPHLHVGAHGIFSDLLRFVQMLKREWDAENNGKLLHLSISSKTAAQVPEFVMEDLPLSRTAALVPEFAMKDLPLGRILMMMTIIIFIVYGNHINYQRKYYVRIIYLLNPRQLHQLPWQWVHQLPRPNTGARLCGMPLLFLMQRNIGQGLLNQVLGF